MKKLYSRQPDRMISGKLRSKRSRDAKAHEVMSVDGIDYTWSYRHGWVVWGKGIKAISISVALEPGRTRELILEFALPVESATVAPREERVREAVLDGIRSALEGGWDPESRGRAFRWEITTTDE